MRAIEMHSKSQEQLLLLCFRQRTYPLEELVRCDHGCAPHSAAGHAWSQPPQQAPRPLLSQQLTQHSPPARHHTRHNLSNLHNTTNTAARQTCALCKLSQQAVIAFISNACQCEQVLTDSQHVGSVLASGVGYNSLFYASQQACACSRHAGLWVAVQLAMHKWSPAQPNPPPPASLAHASPHPPPPPAAVS